MHAEPSKRQRVHGPFTSTECEACEVPYLLGSIGAGRLAAGLVKLAVDGPARLVLLTST